MTKDGWFEERTRIPFIGIVAIVLIVAVIAVVLHGETELNVQGENDDRPFLRGKASDSFQGIRGIPLTYKERLHGMLNMPSGGFAFTIDVPEKLLTINREEVLLTQTERGLTATFEYARRQVTVDVFPAERTLVFQADAEPIVVLLADIAHYEGFFLYRSNQYLFQFSPAGEAATVRGDVLYNVAVDEHDGLFIGTWHEHGNSHPLIVDLAGERAEIHDMW